MSNLSIQSFLPQAINYIHHVHPIGIPGWSAEDNFEVSPLKQGEYHMNFLVRQGQTAWVLRVNTGSQLGLSDQEQIAYEYQTLVLLEPSGVSATPLFLDNTLKILPYGVLGMEYLPGEPLNYRRDLVDAARLFARFHQLEVPESQMHLMREERPLTSTYQRCRQKLQVYHLSDLAKPALKSYLTEVCAWADEARLKESYFLEDPWNGIINTEVNNANWIVDRKNRTLHLVDWEKPLWGDPSRDLSHFRVPTTTLWKTDYRMSDEDKKEMMGAYKAALTDAHLRDTIEERTRIRDPFNCLRGVSWCAMTWVRYQQDENRLINPDTQKKLEMYVNLDFVRSLFDPYLNV